MSDEVEEDPRLKFGPEQLLTFAPIAAVIESFGRERGLKVSRVLDHDPLAPDACCFLSWPQSFIKIGAVSPFTVGEDFKVWVHSPRRSLKKWDYSVVEGTDRLRSILEEAKALSDQDALSPEEEVARIARIQEGQARLRQAQHDWEARRAAAKSSLS